MMKINKCCICVLLAILTLFCCGMGLAEARTVVYYRDGGKLCDSLESASLNDLLPIAYQSYSEYGITYDATDGALYYNGELVRSFTDALLLNDECVSGLVHENSAGTIDVYTIRSSGRLDYDEVGFMSVSGIESVESVASMLSAQLVNMEQMPYEPADNTCVIVSVVNADSEDAPEENASIAIIGGADGPTAIFVAGSTITIDDSETTDSTDISCEIILSSGINVRFGPFTTRLELLSAVTSYLTSQVSAGILTAEEADGMLDSVL